MDPAKYYEGYRRGLTVGDINIGGASKRIIDKALGPNPKEYKELPVHLGTPAMRAMEEVVRCDKCGATADGDRVDCIYHFQCGHDICTLCEHRMHRKHPEVKFPMQWCPACDREVKGPYAQ